MEKTKKIIPLTENHMFGKVYRRGKSYVSPTVALYVLRNYDRKTTKVGLTVSKTQGNAVVRNRIKRKMREAYRVYRPNVKDGYLLVIVARKACISASVATITDELQALLTKAALMN